MFFEDEDEYEEELPLSAAPWDEPDPDTDPLNACDESEVCLDCPHYPDCDGCGGYEGRRKRANTPPPKRKPRPAPVKREDPPPPDAPEKMTTAGKVCAGIMGSLFFGLIAFLYLYFYLL